MYFFKNQYIIDLQENQSKFSHVIVCDAVGCRQHPLWCHQHTVTIYLYKVLGLVWASETNRKGPLRSL